MTVPFVTDAHRTNARQLCGDAIAWCKRRFPTSTVEHLIHNLFDPPAEWSRGYQFVLESYTLQVLPTALRLQAIKAVSDFVADDGTLLIICRARDESSTIGQMPWAITERELLAFGDHGLTLVRLEDFHDSEDPPVHRFLAEFRRA